VSVRVRCGVALTGLVVLVGCSAPGTPGPRSDPSTPPQATSARPSPTASSQGSPAGAAAAHLTPPQVKGVTWIPSGQLVRGLPAAYVARVQGGAVALLWMDPTLLRFRYVPGTQFPESSPVRPVDRRPSTWVPTMVAAFNGGFELKDSAGGYFYAGSTVRPLLPGLAAMSVAADGRLSVGVWGRDLAMSPSVVAVRENLRPLVDNYVSRASPKDSPAAWGNANGSLIHANRSALAQLDDGSLVFAYGLEVRAWQIGTALVLVHAKEAIMLDMNKSWPSGFTYTHHGTAIVGKKIHPAIYRSPTMYVTRFKKDFVVALAVSP
jgi:hypothetical protein